MEQCQERISPVCYLPLEQLITTVLLAPVYKPVIHHVVKIVKDWTEDSVARLQGCFDCTDWQMFDQTLH